MSAWKRSVAPVLAVLVIGCGDGGVVIGPIGVATVEVSPRNPALQVGQRLQLVVVVKDSSGNVLQGRAVTWRSDDTAVVTITATGSITAVGAGSTRARATAGGVDGSVTVTVTAPSPVVASIAINPVSAVVVGGAAQ